MQEEYVLTGIVVKGNQRGRTIGFPTANINPGENITIPVRNGVYAARIRIREKLFDGMANIGIRPTLDEHTFTIEVHIFNFSKDIYGQEISIILHDFIRPERKFSSLEELKSQISHDKLTVSMILSGRSQTDTNTQ